MKYFEQGLDKAALKIRYRELAKQYHPDLHQDKAAEYTIIMQEINQEYDNYFTAIVVPFTATTRQYEQAKQEAKRYRERIILFMVRDKRSQERGHFVGFRSFGNGYGGVYTSTYYSIGDNWKDFRTGLALCEIDESDILGGTVERIPAEFEMPNFKDILKYHNKTHIACARFSDGYYADDDMFHHISTQSGEYVVSCFNQPKVAILVMLNGELNSVWVKKSFLGPINDLESIGLTDMYFQEYTGYTYDEFSARYDINYAPQFADVVGNVLVKDMYFDNPAIGYCLRKGILRIYAAKSNYKMKYGTFDYRLLVEYLPNLDIEDIDEMQDILDEINPKYEEMVKGMIKKGKIRIKV